MPTPTRYRSRSAPARAKAPFGGIAETRADDHVGFLGQHRRNQVGGAIRGIRAVAVDHHHDVGVDVAKNRAHDVALPRSGDRVHQRAGPARARRCDRCCDCRTRGSRPRAARREIPPRPSRWSTARSDRESGPRWEGIDRLPVAPRMSGSRKLPAAVRAAPLSPVDDAATPGNDNGRRAPTPAARP